MNFFSKKTIRNEIFSHSIVLTTITLICFVLLLSVILYKSGINKAEDIIQQRNHAVSFFIDGYFSEINNTVEILSRNEDIRNAPFLDKAAKQRILSIFRTYQQINHNITFIYAGYENKEFLINNFEPPLGYDPTVRPWYVAAKDMRPDISTGVPYHEIKSNQWLLSTSRALYTDDNRYTGVISSDSAIEVITNKLEQNDDSYSSSYSFVINHLGTIILHHKKALLNKNIAELIDQPINLGTNEGALEYRIDTAKKMAHYRHCNEADWIVVTVVEKNEIISAIAAQILLTSSMIATLIILLGFAQSVVLSKRFSTPLSQLQKKVKAITSGHWENDPNDNYPDNEIGVISREIVQLTAQELYVRSQELEKANALLEQQNSELERLSTTDQLTGLFNRHKIDTELENECQRCGRYGKDLTLIMFDIDWFKQINDNYGHQAGDSVLKDIAALLKNNLRNIDLPGRWGGEEFIVICPETELSEAQLLAERLRGLVAEFKFSINRQVTISVGVTQFSGKENPDNLTRRVDANLYAAKHQGKNTVITT